MLPTPLRPRSRRDSLEPLAPARPRPHRGKRPGAMRRLRSGLRAGALLDPWREPRSRTAVATALTAPALTAPGIRLPRSGSSPPASFHCCLVTTRCWPATAAWGKGHLALDAVAEMWLRPLPQERFPTPATVRPTAWAESSTRACARDRGYAVAGRQSQRHILRTASCRVVRFLCWRGRRRGFRAHRRSVRR